VPSTNWRGYRIAACIGRALLILAIVVVALMGDWKRTLALADFLGASFAADELPYLLCPSSPYTPSRSTSHEQDYRSPPPSGSLLYASEELSALIQ
jgi:hypothetical protein